MAKTLVVAEKPSVGRDLASALPGKFDKDEGFLESDEYVITWAVGHLVQLADPEEYDEKFKKWKMADLPIVPEDFHLVPRDAKSKKQLNLILKLMKREDVSNFINACDAGREGELIFAYIYEMYRQSLKKKDGEPKRVQRLWISSMTKQAIREGFEKLRPGEQMDPLEQAARLTAAVDALYRASGGTPTSAEAKMEERFIAPLRDALDQGAWAHAAARGEAMTLADAIAASLGDEPAVAT